MSGDIPGSIGAHRLFLADSIAEITPAHAGCLVISGSHGGRSAAAYALAVPLALVAFNDAGVGKERAGIVALGLLEATGTPCITVSHLSARIGDARDAWHSGTISFVNDAARIRGMRVGEALSRELLRAFA